jgi:hypothetical protein
MRSGSVTATCRTRKKREKGAGRAMTTTTRLTGCTSWWVASAVGHFCHQAWACCGFRTMRGPLPGVIESIVLVPYSTGVDNYSLTQVCESVFWQICLGGAVRLDTDCGGFAGSRFVQIALGEKSGSTSQCQLGQMRADATDDSRIHFHLLLV